MGAGFLHERLHLPKERGASPPCKPVAPFRELGSVGCRPWNFFTPHVVFGGRSQRRDRPRVTGRSPQSALFQARFGVDQIMFAEANPEI